MFISYVYVSLSTHIYAATSECTMYSITTEVTAKATNGKKKEKENLQK
jgi:hypothetical protein